MLHPKMHLQWISDSIGYGVFATQDIPKGTITFVQDALDISISTKSPLLEHPSYKALVEKYSYTNGEGELIISWDHGKFMNHCCFSNTITTGYGFEIAIRNIKKSEEITDDYGVFTLSHAMEMSCKRKDCRKLISSDEFETNQASWDKSIISALGELQKVEQALWCYLSPEVISELDHYLESGKGYKSVAYQRPGFYRLNPSSLEASKGSSHE